MTEKRKQIEALIDKCMSTLDPSGSNAQKYRKMFQTMSDKEFDKYMTDFLNDPLENFRLDIEEFDHKHSLKWENVVKAAKAINIPLFEYIYQPWLSSDPEHPIRSKAPVLVGYLNFKRPQQFVVKKTGLATTDNDRDDMTGIAKGDAKGGTMTGVENELLAGIGADKVLKELLGTRGDNDVEYSNMVSAINETGTVRLQDITTSAMDKPTLLKSDLFLMAMGLKTDLVSASYYSIDKIKTKEVGL